MARYDSNDKVNIPSISSFRIDTLRKNQQYIIIGNFNYVPSEPRGLITGAEGLEFKQSGLSNEVFFEVMHAFASHHGKRMVMFEEESLVIYGGQKTLDSLNIECGERFCYMPSSADEICDFCAHEKEVIQANASNTDQPHASVAETNHAQLDS